MFATCWSFCARRSAVSCVRAMSCGGVALGLIAGEGVFPLDVARCARRAGRRLVCVALHRRTDERIEALADEVVWIRPGEVEAGLAAFRDAQVREGVMAGKVPKLALLKEDRELGLEKLIGLLKDFLMVTLGLVV